MTLIDAEGKDPEVLAATGRGPGEPSDLPPTASVGDGIPATPGSRATASVPGRSQRAVVAIQIGYVYQAAVMVVGLWLTPFLFDRLGQEQYGLWSVTVQVLGWLSLLDLGIVAILPREVAYVTGHVGSDTTAELRALVGRTVAVILWQLPVVALASVLVWVLLPDSWSPVAGPLLLVTAAFVVLFPLRMLQAVLQGLQDIVFTGAHSLIAWLLGFLSTVGFVLAGAGLYAVAIGWIVVQAYIAGVSWARLHVKHPGVLPSRIVPLGWDEARKAVGGGVWVSVSQIAQVLLAGTDMVIIAAALGPAAVVPYSLTAKLVGVLASQPHLIMQVALPAIAQIRAEGDIRKLQRVALALSQAMLIGSGTVFCVVLVVNEPFIAWLMHRSDLYGGDVLTGLLLVSMILRHWNFAATYTLFSLGGERRISLTTLADGVVTISLSMVLVRLIGLDGAPIASILGVVLVSLPANLRGIAQRAGVPAIEWLRPLSGWAWRFVVLAIGAVALAHVALPPHLSVLVLTATLVGLGAVGLMVPVALAPPIGDYLNPQLRRLTGR